MGNIFTLIVNFVFSLVLVQRLSDNEFGLQAAIVAFSNIVMALASMGLFTVTSRELANRTPEQQHEIYNSVFSLQLVMATVVCGAAGAVAALLGSFPGPQFIILLLGLFSLVLSYAPIAPTEALLIVRGQMWRMASLQSQYAFWSCLAGILIVFQGGGIGPIYIALAILSIVTILLYMREAWRLVPGGPRLVFRPREWAYYLGEGFPGGLGSFFFITTRSIGTYLVYTFLSETHAGYLGVSFMLIQATTLIVWVPYAVSILPVMTRLYSEARDQLQWLASRSITWLMAVTLPVAIGTTLLAPEILRVLGESKVAAAPTLRIFIWTIPLTVLVEFFFRMLLVAGRQRVYLIATALGAILNIGLCLVLIPHYGLNGGVESAALAALIGTGVIAVLCGWEVRSWLLPQARPSDLLRLSLALIGMALAVQTANGLSVYMRIGIGALVYGVIALVLGLFSLGDWHTARTLFATATADSSSSPM